MGVLERDGSPSRRVIVAEEVCSGCASAHVVQLALRRGLQRCEEVFGH